MYLIRVIFLCRSTTAYEYVLTAVETLVRTLSSIRQPQGHINRLILATLSPLSRPELARITLPLFLQFLLVDVCLHGQLFFFFLYLYTRAPSNQLSHLCAYTLRIVFNMQYYTRIAFFISTSQIQLFIFFCKNRLLYNSTGSVQFSANEFQRILVFLLFSWCLNIFSTFGLQRCIIFVFILLEPSFAL